MLQYIYESDLYLWWPGKLCTCAHETLVKTHTVLVNSIIFPKYDVRWDCLLVYPLSLNVDLTNLQKVIWALLLGRGLPD